MYENVVGLKAGLAPFTRMLDFGGRSTRTELLCYFILAWLVSAIVGYVLMVAGVAEAGLPVTAIAVVKLLLLLPYPALVTRRLHDQGRPGWLAILFFAPTAASWIFGGAATGNSVIDLPLALLGLVMFLALFLPQQDGPNAYGPDPRLDPAEQGLAVE
jgi:uncharacterized membrane protein YhaH (DUF805 family)